jgi:hypothetical protein
MNYDEIKLWVTNALVITITFSEIENVLKLILLLSSIGYTLHKWIELYKKNKKDETE